MVDAKRDGILSAPRTRLSQQPNRPLLAPPIPAGKRFGASRDWGGIFRDNAAFA
jgi:hypothetical protein